MQLHDNARNLVVRNIGIVISNAPHDETKSLDKMLFSHRLRHKITVANNATCPLRSRTHPNQPARLSPTFKTEASAKTKTREKNLNKTIEKKHRVLSPAAR
jgi:hypothetical protein